MFRLLFFKIKNTFCSNKLLTIIILLSITASLFCINVMLGYAEDRYRASYAASWFSTICINNVNNADYNEIRGSISEKYGYEIGSALCFSKLEDETILIGWEGSDPPSIWFPEMSGRFFTEDELGSTKELVYLSRDVYKSNQQPSAVSIGDVDYEVIGYGWIITINFLAAVGERSSQTILSSVNQDELFMIIPQLTYEQYGYSPEIILVHINEITYNQLAQLTADLQRDFPDIEFTQSDNNSDDMKTMQKIMYVPFGVVLSLIIGVSLIQMINVWLSETKKVTYSYIVCGTSRKRMLFILLAELLIFVAAGEILALTIQRLILPILSYIGVSYMPNVRDIIITAITAYVAIILLMFKRMAAHMDIKRDMI